MSIEIVSIGNEILRGMLINTNAAYLGRRLAEEGWVADRQTTLSDDVSLLTQGLDEAIHRSSVVISTGGLGPTLDDNTAEVSRNLFTTAPHVIPNPVGSAEGFIFHENQRLLFLLPGVPAEMEKMFEESVLPYLQNHVPRKVFYQEILYFFVLNESEINPLLQKLQKEHELDIGIYPAYGTLTVVLRSPEKNKVDAAKKEVEKAFADHLVAAPFQQVLHEWFREHRKTLAFAESCTGGLLASKITAIAGASDYFLGSFVVYSDQLKENILGVSPETLKKYGAVSKETVKEMWNGLKQKTGADYGIAVTGIAGPSGGSPDKPVGTVFYAIGEKQPVIGEFHLKGSRQTIILLTTLRLLALLLKQVKS